MLACFGGAGGQHACAIAKSLGIKKIMVNRYSGILSAYGLSLADVVYEKQEPCNLKLNAESMNSYIVERLRALETICVDYLIREEKFARETIESEFYLNLRYYGTDNSIMCLPTTNTSNSSKVVCSNDLDFRQFEASFLNRYKEEYGFTMTDRNIIVDDIRVRCIGKTNLLQSQSYSTRPDSPSSHGIESSCVRKVFFDNAYVDTRVYMIESFYANDLIHGPAIIIDKNSTILVEPFSSAHLTSDGNIVIEIEDESKMSSRFGDQMELKAPSIPIKTLLDTTTLSIFSHRFMRIAEQMVCYHFLISKKKTASQFNLNFFYIFFFCLKREGK